MNYRKNYIENLHSQALDSYTPSQELWDETEKLRKKHPLKDIPEILRSLGKFMLHEEIVVNANKNSYLEDEITEARKIALITGKDIIAIGDVIANIITGNSLEQANLKLFESESIDLHPLLKQYTARQRTSHSGPLTVIDRELNNASDWCRKQADSLRSQEETPSRVKTFAFLNDADLIFQSLKEWAEVAAIEIKNARKSKGQAA